MIFITSRAGPYPYMRNTVKTIIVENPVRMLELPLLVRSLS